MAASSEAYQEVFSELTEQLVNHIEALTKIGAIAATTEVLPRATGNYDQVHLTLGGFTVDNSMRQAYLDQPQEELVHNSRLTVMRHKITRQSEDRDACMSTADYYVFERGTKGGLVGRIVTPSQVEVGDDPTENIYFISRGSFIADRQRILHALNLCKRIDAMRLMRQAFESSRLSVAASAIAIPVTA